MYFIDAAYNSINKYGEEICGDHIEQVNLKDSKILVLSDGLGSGVKANILATLTSKIAATMLKEGSTLEETIDTIVHTLPICSERKLAYSTFTIIKVYRNGEVYVAEFDNPSIFLLRNGRAIPIVKTKRIINGKTILESKFRLDRESLLVAVSDGVVHAGVGVNLDLGWEWHNVKQYLKELSLSEKTASTVTERVLSQCQKLYNNKAGDDTTVIAVKIRERETINLLTGPPKNPQSDFAVIQKILRAEGKVVVCGGTTANIVAKQMGCEVEIDLSTMTPDIPPIAYIPNIALTTEGVITINKAVGLLKLYIEAPWTIKLKKLFQEKNAASMLAKLLLEDCDKLNIWMGQAVNPAHQEENFSMNFDFKSHQIHELARLVKSLGREVHIYYI